MPFQCRNIILSCEGKEKCEWERFFYVRRHVWRRVYRNGEWRLVRRTIRVEKHKTEKHKVKAMDFKVPLMDLS
jgi:hypothetical protein